MGQHDAKSVHEADRDDERRVPSREQGVEARGPRGRVGEPREEARAVAPAEEEVELVACEARHGGDRDHGKKLEIAPVRGEPGEREHRLALEERADRHRDVAVGVDERRKVEGHRALRAGTGATAHAGRP